MSVRTMLSCLLVALLVFASVPAAANAAPISLYQAQPGLCDEKIQQTVLSYLETMRTTMAGNDTRSAYLRVEPDFARAYQVFILTEPDLADEFGRRGNMASCISDKHVWKVPLIADGRTHAVATVAEDDAHKWEVCAFGIKTKEEEYGPMGDAERLTELLATEHLRDMIDLKAVTLPLYHATLLYIRTADQEYAIVLSPMRFSDIATHKAYRAEDLIAELRSASDTASADGQSNGGTADSGSTEGHGPLGYAWLLVGFGGILLAKARPGRARRG